MGFMAGKKKKKAKAEADAEAKGAEKVGSKSKSRRIVVPGGKGGNRKSGSSGSGDASSDRQANVQKRPRKPSQGGVEAAPPPPQRRPAAARPAKPAPAAKPAPPKPAPPPPPAASAPPKPAPAPPKPAPAPPKPAGPIDGPIDLGGGVDLGSPAPAPAPVPKPAPTPGIAPGAGKKPVSLSESPDLQFAGDLASGGVSKRSGAISHTGDRPLIEFLVTKANLIDQGQAQQAMAKAGSDDVPVDTACVELGFITEDQLVNALTQECWVPHLKVDKYEIRKKALDTINESDARYFSVLPVDKLGSILNLAMVNPLDAEAIQNLEQKTGLDIKKVVATRGEIDAGIAKYYGGDVSAKEGSLQISQDKESRRVTQMLSRVPSSSENDSIDVEPEEAPLIAPEPIAQVTPDLKPDEVSDDSAQQAVISDPVKRTPSSPDLVPEVADIDDLLAGDEDVAPSIIEPITIEAGELEEDIEEPEFIEDLEVAEAPEPVVAPDPVVPAPMAAPEPVAAAPAPAPVEDSIELDDSLDIEPVEAPAVSEPEPVDQDLSDLTPEPQSLPKTEPSIAAEERETAPALTASVAAEPDPTPAPTPAPAPVAEAPAPEPAAAPAASQEPGTKAQPVTTASAKHRKGPDFISLVPVMEEDFQHAITHGKSRIFEKWVSLQTRNRILNAVTVESELDEVLSSLYAHGEKIDV